MAKQDTTPSVLFYKRMIAATLAAIILILLILCIVFGAMLARTSGQANKMQERLMEYEAAELQRLAEEEAERQRNAIPPERVKPVGERSAPEILADSTLILHALGSTEGVEGLNCLEGFLEHYNAGARVFEVDLRMTSDGYAVLRHDWLSGIQEGIDQLHIPTLEQFLATPINGKYTPLSFHDLLLLMEQYPDICIVTDTKLLDTEAVTQQFQSMTLEARKLGMSYLFDRMIVQIYSPEHFTVVDGVYHFPHYIYTLYQDYFGRNEESFRNKVVFCENNGIMGLTLDVEVWVPDYVLISNWHGVNVYAHTINTAEETHKLLHTGIKAVYTDFLNPSDLEG